METKMETYTSYKKSLLETIPNEILYYILSFLNASELSQCTKINHLFYALSNESTLWRRLCEKRWPDQFCKFDLQTFEKQKLRQSSLRTIHHNKGVKDPSFWKNYYIQKYYLEAKQDCLSWSQIQLSSANCGGIKPSPRYAHSGTIIDNNIVYIGGQLAQKIRYNDVFFYNTETGHFTLPKVRGEAPNISKHTAVEINGRFYVFGGFDGIHQRFELNVFDPRKLTWESPSVQGDKPISRSNHAAAAIGDKMYIFGGLLQQDSQLIDSNDLYVLDTSTLTWSKPPVSGDLPEARCGHRLVPIDDKLYMFGGGNGDNWGKKFNNLYVFDPETNTWIEPQTTGVDVDSTTFASAFVLGKFLFVFGGGKKSHRGQVTNEVFCYDTVTQHWTKQRISGHPPIERDDCTTNVVGDAVYFMHGYNSGPIDEFWTMKMHPSFYRAAFQKEAPVRVNTREYGLMLSPSLRKMRQRLSQITLSPFSLRKSPGPARN